VSHLGEKLSEDQELELALNSINAAKDCISRSQAIIAGLHHLRIEKRLEIIKEELVLLSVIVEHEAGLLGGSDVPPDTDPSPDEEATQVNLEPPPPPPVKPKKS